MGSRIAAVGLGASATFGIMTVLGLAAAETKPEPAAPVAAVSPPVLVVVHRGTTDTAPSAAPREPIRLVANSIVRTVEAPAVRSPSQPQPQPRTQAPAAAAAPAPEARTSGSN